MFGGGGAGGGRGGPRGGGAVMLAGVGWGRAPGGAGARPTKEETSYFTAQRADGN